MHFLLFVRRGAFFITFPLPCHTGGTSEVLWAVFLVAGSAFPSNTFLRVIVSPEEGH